MATTSDAERAGEILRCLIDWVIRIRCGSDGERVAEYLDDITRRGKPITSIAGLREAAEAYCVQWVVRERCRGDGRAIGAYLDTVGRHGEAISRIPRLRDRCRAEWRAAQGEATT